MRFALADEPVDYQITVHYNNYIAHYGAYFLDHLEYVNTYMARESVCKQFPLMHGFIITYGYDKLIAFHSMISASKVVAS